MTMNWRERIERDPGTLHGEPHIRGTRIPVSAVVNNVAIRADLREVLASYPSLSEEDVRACVAYAAERSHAKDGVIDADFDESPEPGEVKPEEAGHARAPTQPPAQGEPTTREPTVHDFVLLGPNVGEDADFERRRLEGPARQTEAGRTAKGFKEYLRSMPDVGEDADFERPIDYGRPDVEWDS